MKDRITYLIWRFIKNKPNISTCPVIAGLMNAFDDDWEEKFIKDEDKVGINWNGLELSYKVVYNGQILGEKRLTYDEIWHLLFDFLQTKDDEAGLIDFCKLRLEWDEDRITQFINISISQGYGSLSKTAISKILPFLQQGFIYSEAVLYGNLSKVLGSENFKSNKTSITSNISSTIKNTDLLKEKLNVVNSLIQKYFSENNSNRAKGVDSHIKEMAHEDVEKKLRN